MKKVFSSIRFGLITICSALLLLSSCKKSVDNAANSTPVAGLMAFNLVTDKPSGVFVTLSNNSLTNYPLQYPSFTGVYLNIYPGTRNIATYDATTNTSIASNDYLFDVNKYYSLFVVGANNVYSNVVTRDNFDSLSSSNGKAYVRYINAIADSSNPRLTVTANGSAVFNSAVHFKTVSPFTEVAPGQVSVNISNEGNIQSSRTITLQQQRAYTILLTGTPGTADSSKAVQVRFVENGTLGQ